MKNEFYSNRNLDFKEKRNRVGRFLLFFGFIVSTILTIVVIFFMVINNLGISPSDQQGFKGVRTDVGREIVNNFQNNGSPNLINDTKFTIKYKDKIEYSVSFHETEELIEFEKIENDLTYTLTLDKKKTSFEEDGTNKKLADEINTFEEAVVYINKEATNYISTYVSYSAKTYTKIVNHKNLRYFYNAEKKQLKFAAPDNTYIIVDDKGGVLKGSINLGTEEKPEIRSLLKEEIKEENA